MEKTTNEFRKVLKRSDVFFLSFGAMIGWGWVVLVGSWINTAGSIGSILSFILGGILIILVGLTYAELTSAIPNTGGEQLFCHRAMGYRASFISAWSILLGYISVISFEAVALPMVVEYIFPGVKFLHLWNVAGSEVYLSWIIIAIAGSVLFSIFNYLGIQIASFLQNLCTIIILLVGITLLAGSIINGSFVNLKPYFIGNTNGVFKVLMVTPFMLMGFNVVPQMAGEINLPPKMIGKLLIFSVILAVSWYILIIFAVSTAMNLNQISNSSLVTADAMAILFKGKWASSLLIFGGMCGILTTWNAFFMGCSRIIYSMAHKGMIPELFGKLHPKRKTPYNAIIFIGIITSITPLFGRKMLYYLSDAGSLGIIVAYGLVAISFLILRKKEPELKRPFKVKNGLVVGLLSVIFSIFFIALFFPGSPVSLIWPYEWIIVIFWALSGFLLYLQSAKSKKNKSIEIND